MDLERILTRYRGRIIKKWVDRLHSGVSDRYSQRPLDELFVTVSAACDASYAVLVRDDLSQIDCHIQWITMTRLQGGFSLSEVQNAYELYRSVLLPLLVKNLSGARLAHALERLNSCLIYTITRFSNYFQSLHEKQIREYAKNLETEVENRTKELADSEAKYRLLIEEMHDGYFVNQDGIIVFANRAFCDIHGYELNEVIGKPHIGLIAPESRYEIARLYAEHVVKEGVPDLCVYRRLHRSGNSFPTESKIKLIIYQGNKAVAGICRDITERLEMERRIRESENLAHIGQLTTSLAHEIRNPLSSVKMNIQILLKNSVFDGNDKRRMEIMAMEISRLERILAEMLDFARPLRLNQQPRSIKEVIESCLEVIDVKVKEKDIRIEKKYTKTIPLALVDRDKMEQAIINVLLNSVEVLPEKGEITILTKHESGKRGKTSWVSVEIKDNGPGITTEDLQYAFDPFFSNKKKGTGLGLSNTKKIIEAHGGTVSLRPGRPCGIHVRLVIPTTEKT
ncbi:MAG: Sporulation kinase E [Syntrophorhabdus sp. PtaU1.Bin050]|nr:MAG: Sporulation kinase E [Syntrophorhabdus sp. PtaU1.Bin050]